MYNETHRGQSALIDGEALEKLQVCIVGAGTIGSWTANALVRLGIKHIDIIDDDTVETHNLATQHFNYHDEGFAKSPAVAVNCNQIYGTSPVTAYTERVTDTNTPTMITGRGYHVMILAVDNLEARRVIANNVTVPLLIDGRMGGEQYELHIQHGDNRITVPETASDDLCTAKGMIPVAMGIAGEIANVVKMYARGEVLPATILRDYKTNTFLKIAGV